MKYTKTPNSLINALFSKELSSCDKAILAVILRKTAGYHRNSYKISIREFQQLTKFSRRSIIYSIEKLELMQFIALVNKGNSKLNFSEWKLGDKLVQLDALDDFELVQNTARTGAMPTPTTEPVNKQLNKVVDDIKFILENTTNARLVGEALYVNDKLVNNPRAYRKGIERNKKYAPEYLPKPESQKPKIPLGDYTQGIVEGKIA